jgi:hypothetical protein
MGRFEALVRAILWLNKRDWGRAVLLGLGSVVALAWLSTEVPIAGGIFEGPVFRAGFYFGQILTPKDTMGGHSLFGLGAVVLALIGFWFSVLRIGRALLAQPSALGHQRRGRADLE